MFLKPPEAYGSTSETSCDPAPRDMPARRRGTGAPLELPTIVIAESDYERLDKVAQAARRTVPAVAEYLSRELERAAIAQAGGRAAHIRMGSYVQFRDNETGRVRAVQLVYPAEADPQSGRISILTPVGAALIGLSEGQTMPWSGRSGERRTLTVLGISAPDGPLGYGQM